MSDPTLPSRQNRNHALLILTRVVNKDTTAVQQKEPRIKEIFRESMSTLKATKKHLAPLEATDPGPVDSNPIESKMTSIKQIERFDMKIQATFQRISTKIDSRKFSGFLQSPTQFNGKEP